MTSGRAAGFGILQEPFEYRIEVSWRFPERGVPHPAQAMTAAFPQISIRDGIGYKHSRLITTLRIATEKCPTKPVEMPLKITKMISIFHRIALRILFYM
jgi:hypothetical protein